MGQARKFAGTDGQESDPNYGTGVVHHLTHTNTLAQHVVPCPLRIEARPGPVKDVVVCPL